MEVLETVCLMSVIRNDLYLLSILQRVDVTRQNSLGVFVVVVVVVVVVLLLFFFVCFFLQVQVDLY